MAKQLKAIFTEVKADGITIQTDRIERCTFKKISAGKWDIKISIKGNYIDKR
jgi:hypothetical protein